MQSKHLNMTKIHFSYLFSVILLAILLAGGAENPFKTAKTPEQKAYVIERSYNIVLLGALDLINNPIISDSIKAGIRSVEKRTTPVIDDLAKAASAYTVAKSALDQGQGNEERLTIVAANIEKWITQAEAAIVSLANIVDKGDSP